MSIERIPSGSFRYQQKGPLYEGLFVCGGIVMIDRQIQITRDLPANRLNT